MEEPVPGPAADPCCAQVAEAAGPSSSRRLRLWELPANALCPVIGVCMPIAALRRLADKALGQRLAADDHELHCGVITECRSRSPLAERVHKALDLRYALALQRAARHRSDAALAQWWREQCDAGELPGAFWAVLTHPRCSDELQERTLGEVHMLQHQVGMATRVDARRLQALSDENTALGQQLAQAQARATQQAAEQARQIGALQRSLVDLRAQAMLRTTEAQGLRKRIEQLQELAPSLPAQQLLAAENQDLREQLLALQRRSTRLQDEIDRLRVGLRRRLAPEPAPPGPSPVAPVRPARPAFTARPAWHALGERAVLCVGGRTASVPAYRALIEGTGGRFLHHDGGAEESAARLEATLAAADLVICQTGCISHDAYWRVKDHCKRTGKRCVFVESPSRHALARALAQVDLPGEGAVVP